MLSLIWTYKDSFTMGSHLMTFIQEIACIILSLAERAQQRMGYIISILIGVNQ